MSSGQAQARPAFVGVFKKTYPELAKSKEVKVNCAVCHNSMENKKKKHRNNYGVALKRCTGQEETKRTKKKIAAALKKIEEKKSHVEGKTYGETDCRWQAARRRQSCRLTVVHTAMLEHSTRIHRYESAFFFCATLTAVASCGTV